MNNGVKWLALIVIIVLIVQSVRIGYVIGYEEAKEDYGIKQCEKERIKNNE